MTWACSRDTLSHSPDSPRREREGLLGISPTPAKRLTVDLAITSGSSRLPPPGNGCMDPATECARLTTSRRRRFYLKDAQLGSERWSSG